MKSNVFPILMISICVLLPQLSRSQDYQPMAIEGAHWIIGVNSIETPWLFDKFSFTIRGDSTVNGIDYKKVYQEFFVFNDTDKVFTNEIERRELYALMRDDSLERKVYAITADNPYDNCPKNEEYLLFDFSVEDGDTLAWCSIDGLRFSDTINVSLADSVRLVNSFYTNDLRNTIYTVFAHTSIIGTDLGEAPRAVIEGIGFESIGPFLEGTIIDYCVGTSFECGLITSSLDKELSQIAVRTYPNPASDLIFLERIEEQELGSQSLTTQILDLSGRVLKTQNFQVGEEGIEIQDLSDGMYILKIFTNRSYLYFSRFIKN